MNLEEKQVRLKELSNPNLILSDQEYEEKEQLEDELRMIHQEETQQFTETKISLGEEQIIIPQKRQKKSILDIIRTKLKKKPATWDEIQQLKLERQRAILKKDIAVANYIRKNPGGKRKEPRSSSKSVSIEKEFGSARDFRTMSGTNDKNKYKGLV